MTRTRLAVVLTVAALALAACSADANAAAKEAADKLPDLTSVGLTAFDCGDGKAIGGSFQKPSAPFVAECWEGSPAKTFQDVANSVQDAVVIATGGENVTDQVCPDDALSAAGGIACRAVLVTKGDSTVLVRTVVVLAEPDKVLAGLPEKPTQEQINAAVTGAAVEVLVGTQSPTGAPYSSAPTASS